MGTSPVGVGSVGVGVGGGVPVLKMDDAVAGKTQVQMTAPVDS